MTPARAEDWSGTRIGVLGGTFDPPHVGHTRMATVARDVLALDRVLFSPAPRPPHKSAVEITPYAHRVAMLEAALANEERTGVTTLEEDHAISFTVDLLHACRARTSADLYFILGADSMAQLAGWRDPARVMQLATLVVFPRGGDTVRADVPGDASVVVFETRVPDVSSSELRARLERGAPVTGEIAPAVADYIARHRLYAQG